MVRLWLLRHAPTAWSLEKRLQGRNDTGISATGRAAAAHWQLPYETLDCRWYSSPLRRCRETAALLDLNEVRIEPRLTEMDWGNWEGRTARELKALVGEELAQEEAKGLDLQPPGGESPRTVQDRVRPWLQTCAAAARDSAAVTHKGVIRAIYALAGHWDMTGPPADALAWDRIHVFSLTAAGHPQVDRLNVPLSPSG